MAKISNEIIPKGDSFFERIFVCPACSECHGFRTAEWPEPPSLSDRDKKYFKAKWTWNGNIEKPTISPSLKVFNNTIIGRDENNNSIYETQCHFVITDGMISFCDDSKHELKGKTVELPDYYGK